MNDAATLGELKRAGYQRRTVKAELRSNLAARIRSGDEVFPGIIGYEDTVLPQVQNALLSEHDFILLGLRGQAKTRLLRALPSLLDEYVPAVADCSLRDDPLAPECAACRRRIELDDDQTPIVWVPREERYHEKLATPDVTMADLIGDIDPIKAAAEKRSFDDPEVIHYGLLPRSNRGIFAINELPDLQARIQVGLFNVLEEGDVQIRGFPVRMPLDVLLVFSANPEDYTHRGSIITPLRDRIASQILTHYPTRLEDALAITRQEAEAQRDGEVTVTVPSWLAEAVEEVAIEARASDFVDQNSGVSARLTIALFENVVSNAERRGLQTGESSVVARAADLLAATSAITGKVELVYEGEREGPQNVAQHLIGRALKKVFDRNFPDVYGGEPGSPQQSGRTSEEYSQIVQFFQTGAHVDLSDLLPASEVLTRLEPVQGLRELVERQLSPPDDASCAAGMEWVLEGLHQASLLMREDRARGRVYRDMLEEMFKDLTSSS